MLGKIHSIETFGTVDGPGIRFVVFLQGCPLRCKYCHNRDTWDINFGTERSVSELIEQILRYKSYFASSGGGVTISGGEPLLQLDFLIELFKKLKELNIHTAIDTSGSFPINDKIKELLKYTDLVLLDIKHIDDKKCVSLTGVSNKSTLLFAKYLSDNNITMWIRQVLIPGFTDVSNDLLELKKFISTLNNVDKVEVLPYHDAGKYKWYEFGEVYELEGVLSPTDEQIQAAKSILLI
jgi:pyruvate formate lyase activating enzyme